MNEKVLHIVSFDNPYPPNYGGVIDVFYKIKALHQIGFAIHLHCFVKEIPSEYVELKKLCVSIYFYETTHNPFHFFSRLPFSVISRSNSKLAENISQNPAPILFEGLKTTCLVRDIRLQKQKKFLRQHNIEHNYYKGIAKSEVSLLKKITFYWESSKYSKYESVLAEFEKLFTLSEFENQYCNAKFHNAQYIPVFHGNTEVANLSGFGEFAFYHGDLKTADNRKAAAFLISVFKKNPEYNLVVASGSNEEFVKNHIGSYSNIKFIKLTDSGQLLELFKMAHVNICWSFQKSGTKLKLINSLFNSRFCIINENIIDDEKVEQLCEKVSDEQQLIQSVKSLFAKSYEMSDARKGILESRLNDLQNANRLAESIFLKNN